MNATLFEMAVASERRVIDMDNARKVARGEVEHFRTSRKPSAVSRAIGAVKTTVMGGTTGG